MTPFEDSEAVSAVLRGLMQTDPPFVQELPREPGRSANRFRHLLSGQATASPEAGHVPASPEPLSEPSGSGDGGASVDLHDRLATLEHRVEELSRVVRRIQQKVDPSVDE